MINALSAVKLSVFALLVIIISGCTNNTNITSSYIDPEIKKHDLQGIMVVAVAKKEQARKDFETAFADALSRHGVRAVASHTLVPATKPDAEVILAAAKKANLETVLVTRYIGASSADVYHPGTIYYGVTPAYGVGNYNSFGGYYGRAYEVAYEQPVWSTNTTHTLVSDLYATETKAHMWQAVSDTIQASSNKKLRNDAISAVIGDLKKQGIVN